MTAFYADSKQCNNRIFPHLFSLLVVLIPTACGANTDSNDTVNITVTANAETNADIDTDS